MEERTIYQTLEDFGNKVQSDLRKSLSVVRTRIINGKSWSYNSNASKNLSQSIAFSVKFKSDTQLQFKLELDEYYKFVDLGVKGKLKSDLAPKSPYKYKDKIPPVDPIMTWLAHKGINAGKINQKLKDKISNPKHKGKGWQYQDRYKKQRSMAYGIALSIRNRGLFASNFYGDVVNDSLFDDLREELSDSFKKDVLIEINKIEIK